MHTYSSLNLIRFCKNFRIGNNYLYVTYKITFSEFLLNNIALKSMNISRCKSDYFVFLFQIYKMANVINKASFVPMLLNWRLVSLLTFMANVNG